MSLPKKNQKRKKSSKNKRSISALKGARTRKQIRFFVTIISILFLNLTLNIVNKLIKWQKDSIDPYWLTGAGMVIVVLVFFPAIAMKYYVNIISEWIWRHTVNLSTLVLQKRPAIIVVSVIILFLLYCGFYWVWFDRFLFAVNLEN